MHGEGSGKRSSKGALWGVKKTTPGMIAMAATLVSTLAATTRNGLEYFPQLTFVCGPDLIFSNKTRGPSNVDWKERFDQYKEAVLRLPSDYSTKLFSWYDQHIFGSIPANGAPNTTAHAQGRGDVSELIERLQRQAIVARESPAPSPALVQPTTAEADLPSMPSVHISGNRLSHYAFYTITKNATAAGQHPVQAPVDRVTVTEVTAGDNTEVPVQPGPRPRARGLARRGGNR